MGIRRGSKHSRLLWRRIATNIICKQTEESRINWISGKFKYIYILHLADAFIQSDLQYIQVRIFFFLSLCMLSGNLTHNLCAANVMLHHWAPGTLGTLNKYMFKHDKPAQIFMHSIVKKERYAVAATCYANLQCKMIAQNSLLAGSTKQKTARFAYVMMCQKLYKPRC